MDDELDTERTTVHVSDGEKNIAFIDTKTKENGTDVASLQDIVRYQYDNHLGSSCLELDENAATISYEEYHPFGTSSYRLHRNDSEASLKRYRYVGKERDEETGLYYYGARYYAAWIGRWTAVDPILVNHKGFFGNAKEKDREKIFNICRNNPYNYVESRLIIANDPNGKDIFIVNSPYKKNAEVKKENMEKILSWMYSSGMGKEMIDEYINNPDIDIYISFSNLGNDYGEHRAFRDERGRLVAPAVDIGGDHLFYEDVEEFKGLKMMNPDKEHHFILINYKKGFSDRANTLDAKRGAKILGHEMGAHTNNNNLTAQEEHELWGQESLDDVTAEGKAEQFNNEIQNSTEESNELELIEINSNRGLFKVKIR